MKVKKEHRMSEARLQELKDELNYLQTVREREVAELLKEARGFGDLSENSEFEEAKNEQGKLYSRIAELEEIILHAVVVDESTMPPPVRELTLPERLERALYLMDKRHIRAVYSEGRRVLVRGGGDQE